jgi:5-bromo-4-chloroindolyl phosphate hydrolysis protein
MIEILIAVGGLTMGFLISLGIHKREHEMIRTELEATKAKLRRHDERIDGHDVNFASFQASLDYLIKASDRNYEAIQTLKDKT